MILRAASEANADAPGGQGRRVRGGYPANAW
jgi:hypothetical protein